MWTSLYSNFLSANLSICNFKLTTIIGTYSPICSYPLSFICKFVICLRYLLVPIDRIYLYIKKVMKISLNPIQRLIWYIHKTTWIFNNSVNTNNLALILFNCCRLVYKFHPKVLKENLFCFYFYPLLSLSHLRLNNYSHFREEKKEV